MLPPPMTRTTNKMGHGWGGGQRQLSALQGRLRTPLLLPSSDGGDAAGLSGEGEDDNDAEDVHEAT